MKHNKFTIPTTFDLGFRQVQVWYDENQIFAEGESRSVGVNSLGTGNIYMQTPVEDELDNEAIYQTFCHEVVHGILYSMGESELCYDERFVDAFAHLLLQFMLTKKGDLLKVWQKDLAIKKENEGSE